MYSLLLSSEKHLICLAGLPAIFTSPPAASRSSLLENAKLSVLLLATRIPLPQLPPLRRPLPRRSTRSFRSYIMCSSRFESNFFILLNSSLSLPLAANLLLSVLCLQVEVQEGSLVCPETGRRFPISDGIPNMLLNEDEV